MNEFKITDNEKNCLGLCCICLKIRDALEEIPPNILKANELFFKFDSKEQNKWWRKDVIDEFLTIENLLKEQQPDFDEIIGLLNEIEIITVHYKNKWNVNEGIRIGNQGRGIARFKRNKENYKLKVKREKP